jgi:tetratricopeptide (TPR) repeat protein
LSILRAGIQQVRAGRPQEAITEYFDGVIAHYESIHTDPSKKVYTARSRDEAILYMLIALKDKQEAIVVTPIWTDAMYAKAYALIELRSLAEAKGYLERAISMAPQNAQYLAELGHVYQVQKEWPQALATYKSAEDAARKFSPPDIRTVELSRAMRGTGYVLIELGRLDEAEEVYRRCLELDQSDANAKSQLQYIRQLRSRTPTS